MMLLLWISLYFLHVVEGQIGVTTCTDTSDCASLSNSLCDTIVTQTCMCVSSQGYTANAANDGCDYDCGSLSNPANGQVSAPTTTEGSTATYSCNSGFILVGGSARTCEASGWSGSEPTCQQVDCGSLSNPANGQVSSLATTEGSTATYSCNSGFMLVGDSTRTCEASGVWNGSEPTCQQVDCGSLSNPANGQVSFLATTEGSTATYSCNSGFMLVGDSTRTCEASGVWNGSEPTCQQVDCGSLSNPANGQVSSLATTEGSTATYSCNSGFMLVGDSTRTCEASGVWNGSEPTCQQDCGSLSNPANGQVSFLATTEGSTATYSCNSGFMLVGDSTRTCEASGVWNGSEPTCQQEDCGSLSNPANGQVSAPATTEGSTATYSCNSCYTLVGDSTRTCEASGWSGSEPTCQQDSKADALVISTWLAVASTILVVAMF
ncbi:E-selectin-like isoform X2 [Mya arenaria]|uniref:E-selectin-like isoform X2 n=1 Tax=Mya arenaria TaxID=6604 RepID=UPI0022E3E9F7|nr:E-selectin-like isoform X2 [Mya arenaria]